MNPLSRFCYRDLGLSTATPSRVKGLDVSERRSIIIISQPRALKSV